MRRGLTLIEVVVATALLAIVVAATLPFFQSSSGAFDSPGDASRDMALLSVAAARLPESPQWKGRGASTELSIEWPGDLLERASASHFRGAPVQVRFPSAATEPDESADSADGDRGAESDASPSRSSGSTGEVSVDGGWVEITCGEVSIYRWVARPKNRRGQRSPRARRRSLLPATGNRPRVGTAPRAFTLVETVIALALVSTLSLAAISWSVTGARLARLSGDRANLGEAARSVLRLIHDDIHTFDASGTPTQPRARIGDTSTPARPDSGAGTQGRGNAPLRVRVEQGVLVIDTRARGSLQPSAAAGPGAPPIAGRAAHRYAFDIERSELSLQVDASRPRVLLRGVTGFDIALDPENRTLDVSITLEGGTVFARSYLAP